MLPCWSDDLWDYALEMLDNVIEFRGSLKRSLDEVAKHVTILEADLVLWIAGLWRRRFI